jgi:hypothetical protein
MEPQRRTALCSSWPEGHIHCANLDLVSSATASGTGSVLQARGISRTLWSFEEDFLKYHRPVNGRKKISAVFESYQMRSGNKVCQSQSGGRQELPKVI